MIIGYNPSNLDALIHGQSASSPADAVTQSRLQQLAAKRLAAQGTTFSRALTAIQNTPLGSPNISMPNMPAPKGGLRNWINVALQDTGHMGPRHNALAAGLYNMIMHESGGNPNAQNNWDSNAKAGTPSIGLMQTIQPTFNAYALQGHGNIRNPVDNIIAGLRYALSRYGAGMVMAGGRRDSQGNYLGY